MSAPAAAPAPAAEAREECDALRPYAVQLPHWATGMFQLHYANEITMYAGGFVDRNLLIGP